MGQILEANCTCGFRATGLFVGGGMMNFETFCGAPALCDAWGVIHVLDYLEPSNQCPDCGKDAVFYNDPTLFSLPPGESQDVPTVFYWNVSGEAEPFRLLDVDYFCPRCREMRLRFASIGFWD